jgi:hypothetical protein
MWTESVTQFGAIGTARCRRNLYEKFIARPEWTSIMREQSIVLVPDAMRVIGAGSRNRYWTDANRQGK